MDMDMIIFNKNTGLVIAKTHPQELDILYSDYPLEFRQSIDTIYTSSSPKNIFDYKVYNGKLVEIPKAELVKLEIMIAGREEEAFSKIIPKAKAVAEGKKIVTKLKEFLPPQMFAVALQAKVGGKFIARETISARRKDVLAPLYGGDYTRKRKLLEKQKKGKKEMKNRGRLKVPTEVFLKVFGN